MMKGELMLLTPCPECGSRSITCNVREVTYDYGIFEARMECDNCSYYTKWTEEKFEKRSKAEDQAEEEWNDPYTHMP